MLLPKTRPHPRPVLDGTIVVPRLRDGLRCSELEKWRSTTLHRPVVASVHGCSHPSARARPPCMLRRRPLPVCLGWGPTAIPRPVLPDSSLALPHF